MRIKHRLAEFVLVVRSIIVKHRVFVVVVGSIVVAVGVIDLYQLYRTVSPTTSGPWQLSVNSTYQDVMKTFMNLVTASLVLPFLFIRNFLRVREDEPIANYLSPSAYFSWAMLFLSLVCCMVFFWASAKYVKVVSGGDERPMTADSFEGLRDWSGSEAVLLFLVGLVALGIFFAFAEKRQVLEAGNDNNSPHRDIGANGTL
jgi:hypothetical protein